MSRKRWCGLVRIISTILLFKQIDSITEVRPSAVLEPAAVVGEGGAGVVEVLLQRYGHAQRDFQALRQTHTRRLISVDIDGRYTPIMFGGTITVEQALMHRGTKFEQDMTATHRDTAADAQASKSTGMD